MGLPSLAFQGKIWLFQIKVTSEAVERSPFRTFGELETHSHFWLEIMLYGPAKPGFLGQNMDISGQCNL